MAISNPNPDSLAPSFAGIQSALANRANLELNRPQGLDIATAGVKSIDNELTKQRDFQKAMQKEGRVFITPEGAQQFIDENSEDELHKSQLASHLRPFIGTYQKPNELSDQLIQFRVRDQQEEAKKALQASQALNPEQKAALNLTGGQEAFAKGQFAQAKGAKTVEYADSTSSTGKRIAIVMGDGTIVKTEYEAPKSNASSLKAPGGYRYTNDGSALEIIPGGPAAQKAEEEKSKKMAAAESKKQEANIINNKIDSALSKVNALTAGLGAKIKNIPGTEAADLEADLTTIKASLGLDKLMEMKSTSKAGSSGLGALSNNEMEILVSSVSNLKQEQSPKQLINNLNEIKIHYNNMLLLNEGINPFEKKSSQTEKIPVIRPDGSKSLIPKDQLETALKRGYKRAE